MSDAEENCEKLHPRNALEAWARVFEFDGSESRNYLDEWKEQGAYQGLKKGGTAKGSIERDVNVNHPTSIREQFSIDKFLEMVPSEEVADERACVAVYDPNMSKERQKELKNQLNSQCGLFEACTSVNVNGEFESASRIAKSAWQKEKSKPQAVRGYCLPAVKTLAANVQNKHHFSAELQQMRNRITELEDQLAGANNDSEKPQRKKSVCLRDK